MKINIINNKGARGALVLRIADDRGAIWAVQFSNNKEINGNAIINEMSDNKEIKGQKVFKILSYLLEGGGLASRTKGNTIRAAH